jgi:molybdenum cofactor cytidylyltransferase
VTAAVVLAAGGSRRLGANKLLLAIDGEPLVHRVARCALDAGLEPVVVVLRAGDGAARAALADLPVVACSPRAEDHSQRNSLTAGLDALPAKVATAIVLLADMPLVTPRMLHTLEHRATSEIAAVASNYGATLAPPVLLRRSVFSEISKAPQGSLARQLVQTLGGAASVVEWPADLLVDVDTPADWERVRHLLSGGPA